MRPEKNLIRKTIIEDVVVMEPQVRNLTYFSLLTDAVKEEINRGAKKIVWDLKNAKYINSWGITDLVLAYTKAAKSGCFMVLANVTENVQDLLVITKLLTVFDAYDSLDAAVDSLRNRSFPELVKTSADKADSGHGQSNI
jgi:anti-sigma B factor antagonist